MIGIGIAIVTDRGVSERKAGNLQLWNTPAAAEERSLWSSQRADRQLHQPNTAASVHILRHVAYVRLSLC